MDISIPDPVCIRCGYLDGITVVLVTDTDDVTYNTGGNVIVNTTDISVTNDGLLLEDPGKSFFDETSIVCIFNGPTGPAVSCTITIEHLCKNKRRKKRIQHHTSYKLRLFLKINVKCTIPVVQLSG